MMTRSPRPIRIEGDIAYVPLTKGYEAVIDAADVPLVDGRFWRVMEVRRKDGSIKAIYAIGSECIDGRNRTAYMHRVILGPGDGLWGDHRDSNGLNNRRKNLRAATATENAHNRKTHRNNTSGVKGVSWNRALEKWQPHIKARGKSFHLGIFDNLDDAARVRAAATAQMHGEFGRLA